ncbi:MAG: hypothetical protein AB7J46_06630 [Candidatus Altimarinota bacterium]
MSKRFRIVGDDDGHYYIIPEEKWEAWEAFLEWSEDGVVPKFAERINHYSNITFSNWKKE